MFFCLEIKNASLDKAFISKGNPAISNISSCLKAFYVEEKIFNQCINFTRVINYFLKKLPFHCFTNQETNLIFKDKYFTSLSSENTQTSIHLTIIA